MSLTEFAKIEIGEFVRKAFKSKIVLRCHTAFEEELDLVITLDDLAEYYATQARNLTSGCRTIAGLTADWRYVNNIAEVALEWFRRVNVEGIRKAGRKFGITPKF